MADIMYLPTAKFGYKYLLVCLDLANNEFDMEPMKHKDADTTHKAIKKMFKREYLDKPKYSLTTDAGTEFRGIFKKWLYEDSIYHKVTVPGRHKQMAPIDNLINQLNSLFNGIANKYEEETGKPYKQWTDHIDEIRILLNKSRRKKLNPDKYELPTTTKKGKLIKPKFKIGDKVHVILDKPKDALNKVQSGKFRTGDYRYDSKVREIEQILVYSGKVLYRYMVSGIKNASYSEGELIKA